MFDPTVIPRKQDRFCVRRLGDEFLILDPGGNLIHSLDGVGAFIWALIDGGATLGGILDRICSEYDVDRATARSDLEAFLAVLRARQLVRISGPAS